DGFYFSAFNRGQETCNYEETGAEGAQHHSGPLIDNFPCGIFASGFYSQKTSFIFQPIPAVFAPGVIRFADNNTISHNGEELNHKDTKETKNFNLIFVSFVSFVSLWFLFLAIKNDLAQALLCALSSSQLLGCSQFHIDNWKVVAQLAIV